MEISGQHRFSAPRERVWELLLDPKILQQCLPGAEDLVEVGPEEYEARMKIGVAAIRGTYQGRVKIVEKDEPNSYRMAFEGKGPAGQISGDAKIDLAEDGEAPEDPDARLLHREGRRVTLAFDPERVSAPALISRLTQRHPVRDLFVEEPPIEELIARLYEGAR